MMLAATVMTAAVMATAVMAGAVVTSAVLSSSTVMIAAVVVASVVIVAVMVAVMMIAAMVIAMAMAAAMMPTIPALAAAKAEAAPEFETDNVPAGTVPTVFIPAVFVAVPSELLIAPRRRRRRRALPDIRSSCQVPGRVIRIGRFAVRSHVRIESRQRQAGVLWLGLAFHDRRDAIHPKSAAGSDIAELKPRVLACCFDPFAHRRGRLRRARERQHHQARDSEQVASDKASQLHAAICHRSGFIAVHKSSPRFKSLLTFLKSNISLASA